MKAQKSGQSDRHPRPSLEEASPQRVQLVDSTGGLDEFAPEPERSLLRSQPPGAPTPRPKVILGDAEASSSNGDEARRVLTSVLLVDPLYRDAKRVLYKHQL